MSEINNNIPNFRINKIDRHTVEPTTLFEESPEPTEPTEPSVVPDPGVLGRSQVKRANGGNIAKTIDETVAIAKNTPALMCCCEGIFDTVYNDLIAQGKNPDDAYMQALLAEEELLEICPHN